MTWSTAITAAPRLFVDSPLSEGVEIAASAAHTHYLGTVLRLGPGEPVRLFNGVDGEWLAAANAPAALGSGRRAARQGMTLTVRQRTRPQTAENGPWLIFALLKRDATDLVIRQAVELGVSKILPVATERTNTARVNEDRLRAIALEAAEQSERLTIPVIQAPQRLESLLAAWPPGRRLFAAFERIAANPPPRLLLPLAARSSSLGEAALLVGPEGGFTPAEREMLRRLPFVAPISLGPFVLRAETAAAAGLALLRAMGWAEYVGST